MSDICVTVPARIWAVWLAEGDAAGEPETGMEYVYSVPTFPRRIDPGERVYVVAGGRLRGYAPLLRVDRDPFGYVLVRGGGAEVVTIPAFIPGFRGYRYRWWDRRDEVPFPEWRALEIVR